MRDDHKRATRTGFIDRYVFPNGELPHVWRVLHEMAGQSLETVDVENLRPHYAQTLIHWVRRLQAHQERAQALIGLRRYRIWSLYLAGCAYAFERGDLAIYQVLAVKQTEPGLAPRPWERRYQYDPDLPAPDAQVQWGEV
ncbi:MAG: class I SAM-dependent methyltransferase [Acidiferrobacteraceae bacterium]